MNHSLDQSTEDLLRAGGDSRLHIDQGGFNKYRAAGHPNPEIMELGSCTCNAVTPRSLAAAREIHAALCRHRGDPDYVESVCETIRRDVVQLLGLADDVEVVLSPSGTDVEFLASSLAINGTRRLVNIVVGPREVGSGTPLAAQGRHYDAITPRGTPTERESALNRPFAEQTTTFCVPLRTSAGLPRPSAEVESDIAEMVASTSEEEPTYLLHAVEHSKTGISQPSFAFTRSLKQNLGSDLNVLVDAAQGRVSGEILRHWLSVGAMVLWTGSKFLSGPPFSGALLVPATLRPCAQSSVPPEGCQHYFSPSNFPPSWKTWRHACSTWNNYGLILRWRAAIREIQAYHAVPAAVRQQILTACDETLRQQFHRSRSAQLLPAPDRYPSFTSAIDRTPTVHTFRVQSFAGVPFTRTQLDDLHRQLATDGERGQQCHLGQPVQLATDQWALRVAIGSTLVCQLADDTTLGTTLSERMDWFAERVRQLVRRIDALATSIDTGRIAESSTCGMRTVGSPDELS